MIREIVEMPEVVEVVPEVQYVAVPYPVAVTAEQAAMMSSDLHQQNAYENYLY